MAIVHTQVAYILHRRDYRETSSIIELLTRDHGRIALIARGSRGRKSRIAGSLMQFTPLLISWQGRGELPYMNSVERADLAPPVLVGKALYSAMYVNELLMYLLQRHDVHEDLFESYHECLYRLADGGIETALRSFELNLLAQLGFALNIEHEAESSASPSADADYLYIPEYGLVQRSPPDQDAVGESISEYGTGVAISGRCITHLQQGGVEALDGKPELLRELKSLMRSVLDHHLGGRKLRSRELFRSMPTDRPGNFRP